ncbi:unnamed protein product [Sphagnum balticum]
MIWSSSDGSKVFGDVIIVGRCDNVPTHKGTTSQHGDVGLTTVAAQLLWKKVLESRKEACQNAVWHNLFIPQQNVQDLMQSTKIVPLKSQVADRWNLVEEEAQSAT